MEDKNDLSYDVVSGAVDILGRAGATEMKTLFIQCADYGVAMKADDEERCAEIHQQICATAHNFQALLTVAKELAVLKLELAKERKI